jgi:hypothetical protein
MRSPEEEEVKFVDLRAFCLQVKRVKSKWTVKLGQGLVCVGNKELVFASATGTMLFE